MRPVKLIFESDLFHVDESVWEEGLFSKEAAIGAIRESTELVSFEENEQGEIITFFRVKKFKNLPLIVKVDKTDNVPAPSAWKCLAPGQKREVLLAEAQNFAVKCCSLQIEGESHLFPLK